MVEAPAVARWRALTPLGVVLFAFAAGLAAAAYNLKVQGFPDFEVFWTAARHAWDPQLYDSAHLTAVQTWEPGSGPRPFIYPPTFLLLAYPFGLLPFEPAYLLWAGVSCAAIAAATLPLVRPAWAAAVVAITFPVLMAAAYGQSVLLAAAGLIGGAVLIERRPALGGALLAVAACIKPQMALLSPILLIGHPRAMASAVATGLCLVLASFVFGPGRWLEWLSALPRFEQLAHALPLKFINPMAPGLILPLKLVVAAAGVALALWGARRTPAERIVGVIGGSLCCTLYAVRPDLGALAPAALAWVLAGASRSDWVRRIAGAGLLGGLVLTPLGVALFLLAVPVAGALEGEGLKPGPGARSP